MKLMKMNRFFIYIVILSVFLMFCEAAFAVEEKDESAQQDIEESKPILPPVVPSSASASPTPSPHIAAPSIPPTVISTPTSPVPGVSPSHIHSSPSMPAHVPGPGVPFQIEIPQVPIIGNVVGKILDKGTETDALLWIEVEDQLFNQSLKIKVRNLKGTPIVKRRTRMRFKDIKVGDAVNVIFTNDGQENIASFISILTEEELKLMTGTERTPQPENPEEEDSPLQE